MLPDPYVGKDASEVFYAMSEHGMFEDGGSWHPAAAKMFYKAFMLAQTITREDLERISM